MPRLVVRSGSDVGRSCEIDGSVIVGRDPTCDLALNDTLVSRRHVRLRGTPTGYVVEDLNSTNGIRLNGVPIRDGEMGPGDELRIGGNVLVLEGVSSPDRSTVTLSGVGSHIEAAVPAPERSEAVQDASVEELRDRLNLFCQVGEALGSAVGLDELLDHILREIFRVFAQADRGFIILAETAQGPFEVRAQRFQGRREGAVTLSRTIVEHVISRREAVLLRDAAQDDRFAAAASIIRHDIRSMMCAPLACAGEVLGAIHIDTTDRVDPFTEAELQTLVAIAPQAAMAIRQQHLVEEHVESQRLAAIGQTVAGLAHCVKNILNGIQGGSYILDRALDRGDTDRLQHGWDMVKRNAAFMSDLVMDMLSYAREREPVYEDVDPSRMLESVRDLVVVRAGDEAVRIACEVEPGLTAVRLDATAMKRCLLNLAVNAVEACEKETGRVQLRCARGPEPDTVRFTVTDNGCGIPPEQCDHLFTMFFSTKGSKGTGLGLAVSQKIVEEHGGRIGVTSIPDEGTEFAIDLPMRSVEQVTSA